MTDLQPTSIKEVRAMVTDRPHLLPVGGGTKPALSTPPPEVPRLDMRQLRGVQEYEPGEFTITALAGTPVAEVIDLLAENGQYLPFDPPLVARGATLGGVVAANTAGPGRYRYGGVRDFLIGIRFVDGQGQLVRSGGKVVKNSAGFDMSKLMVGSMGRLGALVELTFKVFPRPQAYATLHLHYPDLATAVQAVQATATASLDIQALDFTPAGEMWLRLAGLREALPDRLDRVQNFLRKKVGTAQNVARLDGAAEADFWHEARTFGWVPEGWAVVKVPLTPKKALLLADALQGQAVQTRYSVGGNVAWLACDPAQAQQTDPPFEDLQTTLAGLGLAGLVIVGPAARPRLGQWTGQALLHRLKQALDPGQRFLEV